MRAPVLAIVFTLAAIAGTATAQTFSTLEERMSAAEFERAGLSKLSPEELAALNAWLQAKHPNSGAGPTDLRGLAPQRTRDDGAPIASRLVGSLDGFRTGTVFRLENGQVWRSVDTENRLEGVRLDAPGITIRKGMFGTWRLKVDGYNVSAKVERVQ